jgi:hypothetical protein
MFDAYGMGFMYPVKSNCNGHGRGTIGSQRKRRYMEEEEVDDG